MSLVAYEYSSDEASSDEDHHPAGANLGIEEPNKNESVREIHDPMKLIMHEEDSVINHLQLPEPKETNEHRLEEEDDEFLRKKALPELLLPAKPNFRNRKVQITIPSIKEFDDVDVARTMKVKPVIGAALPQKSTNLLSLLPKPRSALFDKPVSSAVTKTETVSSSPSSSTSLNKRLVPDSVANRPRSVPLSTLKQIERRTVAKDGKPPTAPSTEEHSDEDCDDEEVDFFSFNKVETLPTVSANEINAMVARKAAEISETVRKHTEQPEQNDVHIPTKTDEASDRHILQPSEDLASERALAALIGGNRAKRARVEQVDLIEITSADIVPSKEDFLRRQLQDETGFVATGHLVGDWTCTSKRKSHITQLANKAQANAQELEAMWAANRQSRRQTQSKYGF